MTAPELAVIDEVLLVLEEWPTGLPVLRLDAELQALAAAAMRLHRALDAGDDHSAELGRVLRHAFRLEAYFDLVEGVVRGMTAAASELPIRLAG